MAKLNSLFLGLLTNGSSEAAAAATLSFPLILLPTSESRNRSSWREALPEAVIDCGEEEKEGDERARQRELSVD